MVEYHRFTCIVCGDDFETTDKRRNKRCSKVHMRDCTICGVSFEITSNMKPETSKFCSHKCSASVRKVVKSCVVCGKVLTKVAKTCGSECREKLRASTVAATSDPKSCVSCGNSFIPTSATQKYCSNDHFRDCEICGESFKLREPSAKTRFCGSKCTSVVTNSPEAHKKRGDTSLKRFGTRTPQNTEELKSKIREANLVKYGVEHPMMLDEFQAKQAETNLKKYGVEHTLQVPEIREQIKKTNLEKYGAENPFGSTELIEKIKKTVLEKYGHEWATQSEEVKDKRLKTNLERYGVPNVMMLPENVLKSQKTFEESVNAGRVIHRKISQINRNFAALLEGSIPDVGSVRFEVSFGKFQADLGIGDAGLLIDLNPTISHNNFKSFGCVISGCEYGCVKHRLPSRDYHFKRAVEALNSDVSLIQVYGWDKESDILKRVRAKVEKGFIKLSARKLLVTKIPQRQANKFFAEHHIQGAAKGQSYCFGLLDGDGELLAVASFGKSRFSKKYDFEFIRYAVKDSYIIHGASQKLFKAFIVDADPDSVVSYVDFNHTTRNTFLPSLGFVERELTGPALVHHNLLDGRKFSSSSVLKVGADRLLNTSYGSREVSGFGNDEIMLLEGFLPVYTAGNRVFDWHKV